MNIRDDTAHLARATFAFQTVPISHPLYWATRLLKVLIGNWQKYSNASAYTSSRLAEYAYHYKLGKEFRVLNVSYKTTGVFGVYIDTVEEKLEDFTYGVFNEFQKLAAYINPQELERGKSQLKRELLSSSDNPVYLSDNIADSVFGSSRNISLIEQYLRIDELETRDIQSLLYDYFTDVDPVVVSFGNLEDLPDYALMRNWTYWNRW